MELKKKIGLISLFLLCIIFLFSTSSYAGTQRWNSLDYDVTLNSDGSMTVVETWDVYASETNTLFKTFDLGVSSGYQIKDAGVIEITDNQEKKLREINQYKYHVDPGCFYALETEKGTYEIAWNIGLDNTSGNKMYKMYYTVENAVKIYNDCTELYWQFLSNENGMYGRNLTGRIRLPDEVQNEESFRVWGHGNLSASIFKDSKSQASFSLAKINSNEMFELRIVTDENIYYECDNKYNKSQLDNILEEENKWAKRANDEREYAREKIEKLKKIIIIACIVNGIILIPFIVTARKYRKIGKELKEKYTYPKSELEYFRDIPDEKQATPTKAMYLYCFNNNTSIMRSYIPKIFSATILNLALKGYISLEVTESKDVKILRTNKDPQINTSEDERLVLELIRAAMLGKDYITPKEFERFAKNEYDLVYSKLNSLDVVGKRLNQNAGNIEEERLFLAEKWKSKASKYLIFAIISIFMFYIGIITPIIGCIILQVRCMKNYKYISILSTKGNEEKNQWKGLKKYIEDYSMMAEREVPDLVMWEKYLVYATAFGISKKVLKQLKAIHPEFFENSENLQNATYWNVMANSNFDIDVFDRFSRGLESVYDRASAAYSAANSYDSSGSGGGGGFSSGGGGRRRWRKLRRSLKSKKI